MGQLGVARVLELGVEHAHAVPDRTQVVGLGLGQAAVAVAVVGRVHRRLALVEVRADRIPLSEPGIDLLGRPEVEVVGVDVRAVGVGAADDQQAARTAGAAGESNGLTLFAVEKGASGVEVERVALADSSKAARLSFDNVAVDADAVVGEVDGGWAPLSRALNAGRAGAAAELVGVAAGASEMTFDYLRQRKQFGKLIGEFQALQHRAAHLYGEIEIARAAALKAAQLLDAGDAQAELFVSVAKAKAGRVSALAVQEGVQMHGGIGMTDEHDIGLYMKREAVLGELFGSPRFHSARVAELSGY